MAMGKLKRLRRSSACRQWMKIVYGWLCRAGTLALFRSSLRADLFRAVRRLYS